MNSSSDDEQQNSMQGETSFPTPDEISARAYFKSLERDEPEGNELQDWLEAEAELKQASQLSTPPPAIQGPRNGKSYGHRAISGDAWLRAVLASTLDVVVSIDLEGKILLISDSVEQMFGWKPQELIGKPVEVLMPEHYRAEHARGLIRYRQTGEAHILGRTRELFALRKDGSTFPCEISVSRVSGQQEVENILTGIIRDSTTRLATERIVRTYADVVENSPIGVVIWHVDDIDDWKSLRLQAANSAASRSLGIRMEEDFGKTITEVFPNVRESRVRQMLQAVRTGQAIDLGETRYQDSRVPARWIASRAFPMSNDCVGLFFEDVTRRKEAEQRVWVEHAVIESLVESSGLIDAAPQILQIICEDLDWDVGVLWTLDRESQLLRCVDVWHSPAVSVPEFEQVSRARIFTRGIGLPGRVWATGRPAWVPDVTRDDNFPRAPVAARENLHAACAFPILNGAEFLGVAEFFNHKATEPDEKLFELMAGIGHHISQFIERRNAETALAIREQELALARQIQQDLLPQLVLWPAGFRVGGETRFAQETGGDYWDMIPMADGRFLIVIGDAVGHGIGAALIMAETRACLRTLSLIEPDVGRLMVLANNYFRTQSVESHHYVTVLLVSIDPRLRSLDFVGAAHVTSYVLDRHGNVRTPLESRISLLGLEQIDDRTIVSATTLEQGDVVFLLTDGIVEALSPEGKLFGIERALNVVRAHLDQEPSEIVEALFQAVDKFSGQVLQDDDWTAVILKVDDDS